MDTPSREALEFVAQFETTCMGGVNSDTYTDENWLRFGGGQVKRGAILKILDTFAAAAVKREREECAKVSAPYHTSYGADVNGCPRFCVICSERRTIRDAIRARAAHEEK